MDSICLSEQMWEILIDSRRGTRNMQYIGHSKQSPEMDHCIDQMYAKRCEVFSTHADCPEPHAVAFDHHEGNLNTPTTDYVQYVESLPQQYPLNKTDVTVSSINRSIRGEYLIEYGAQDTSGNIAAVVFRLGWPKRSI
jgi:hypothetical protein